MLYDWKRSSTVPTRDIVAGVRAGGGGPLGTLEQAVTPMLPVLHWPPLRYLRVLTCPACLSRPDLLRDNHTRQQFQTLRVIGPSGDRCPIQTDGEGTEPPDQRFTSVKRTRLSKRETIPAVADI